MRRKITLLAMCLLGLTACSMNQMETTGSEMEMQNVQTTQSSSVERAKHFRSVEELQQLSDSELMEIVDKNYQTTDFISDLSCGEIDLFDVPLADGEKILVCPIRLKAPIDMDAALTDKQLQDFVNESNQNMVSGDTFSNTEVIYCGENEDYLMYSIRYTENREYYDNDSLVSKKIPRAYRIIYPKRKCSVQSDAGLCMGILGELTAETVYRCMDLSSALSDEPVVYRSFHEESTTYVYEAYIVQIAYGDWGLDDSVCIQKETYTVDKITHLVDLTYDTVDRKV